MGTERSPEPRDLMAALRASLEAAALCLECACEKGEHGSFGWTGCPRRFLPPKPDPAASS